MSLSQVSANILRHVCSTVHRAIARNSPSPKVAGVVFFTAAQALAFYIFATVDDFNFPITTQYLSLRGGLPDSVWYSMLCLLRHARGIRTIEEAIFNAVLRIELAVNDRIRGDRDREFVHTIFHDLARQPNQDLIPCPCLGYPRLGILPCYPLMIRLIRPTLELGHRIYNVIRQCDIFAPDDHLYYSVLQDSVRSLGQLLGRGFVEGSPGHGATLEAPPLFATWWITDDGKLFFNLDPEEAQLIIRWPVVEQDLNGEARRRPQSLVDLALIRARANSDQWQ